jgi:iron(III) transport system substrate-binding protein
MGGRLARARVRTVHAVTAAALVMATASACGDDTKDAAVVGKPASDKSIVDGARKEGSLTVYSSMNIDDLEDTVKTFTKKYPFLKVDYVRVDNDALIDRMLTEARAGQYDVDVYSGSGDKEYLLEDDKLLGEYSSPQATSFPPEDKSPDNLWTASYLGISVPAYNTDLVEGDDVPQSYDDFLDPKWQGKIGMYSDDNALWDAMMDNWGEDKTVAWWTKFAAQEPALQSSMPLIAELLAAGQFDLAEQSNLNHISAGQDDGAHIEALKSADFFWPASVNIEAVMAHAPHPNAAKLWVDWVLSDEGQRYLSDHFRTPSRPGVSGPGADAAAGATITVLDPAKARDRQAGWDQLRQIMGLSG